MRLVTYEADRGPRAGILRDGYVVDVWDALDAADAGRSAAADPTAGPGAPSPPSLRALLASGRVGEAGAIPGESGVRLDEARLLPPIPDPPKIIGIGLNYRSHAEETGQQPPATPTFFAKWANALVPSGAEVALPAASDQVDYEAEVAFVVGRRARNVPEADAVGVIAGYTLVNDFSARDLQFATPQWMPGKVFDGAAPCGPSLVTPDEAGAPDAIEVELVLNGETMQSGSTSDLIHSIPALVAYLSSLMTLEPGDIVSTGTPAGVGQSRDPQVWLRPGDEVVVASPTLGRLENRLTAPA